ncbi:MAG: hypothetical protein ABIS20_23360 [Thermoanaerobaculia bacterium]
MKRKISNRPGPAVPAKCRYRLFGLTVTCNFYWTASLPVSNQPADLILSLLRHPFLEDTISPPLYISALRDRDGASLGRLYREFQGEILRFSRAGDFRIRPERIDGYVPDQERALSELRLLGPVMSYWFELRGLPTLHASAVTMNSHAIAFVSHHGGGKSGIAGAMVQAGFPLLTDDLLVLEEREDLWEARPSYPEMRMWPDEAAHFVGSPEVLLLVHKDSEKRRVAVGDGGFGSFHDASTPLSCIYLASRRQETDGGIEIQQVSRSEALIELVRHSFSPRLVEAAGLQPARLDRLARLVRNVPVRRLIYPSGFERLPEVAEILLRSW